jgi:hypothetical protein
MGADSRVQIVGFHGTRVTDTSCKIRMQPGIGLAAVAGISGISKDYKMIDFIAMASAELRSKLVKTDNDLLSVAQNWAKRVAKLLDEDANNNGLSHVNLTERRTTAVFVVRMASGKIAAATSALTIVDGGGRSNILHTETKSELLPSLNSEQHIRLITGCGQVVMNELQDGISERAKENAALFTDIRFARTESQMQSAIERFTALASVWDQSEIGGDVDVAELTTTGTKWLKVKPSCPKGP